MPIALGGSSGKPYLPLLFRPRTAPAITDLVLIGERDHDVPACHAAQLVERLMDHIGVLEHIECDDDVRSIVGHRDAFVEIGEDVRRRRNVQADIRGGMSFDCLEEGLIAASDIE